MLCEMLGETSPRGNVTLELLDKTLQEMYLHVSRKTYF